MYADAEADQCKHALSQRIRRLLWPITKASFHWLHGQYTMYYWNCPENSNSKPLVNKTFSERQHPRPVEISKCVSWYIALFYQILGSNVIVISSHFLMWVIFLVQFYHGRMELGHEDHVFKGPLSSRIRIRFFFKTNVYRYWKILVFSCTFP